METKKLKHMFKLPFLILLLISSFKLISQVTDKVAPVQDINSDFIPYRLAFESEGVAYFFYRIKIDKIQVNWQEANGVGIVAYDKNLKEIFRKDLTEKNKSVVAEYYSSKDEKINVIISKKENDKKNLKFVSFNKKGEVIFEKLLKSYDDDDSPVNIRVSQDKSKIAIISANFDKPKKQNFAADVLVVNTSGDKLWSKIIDYRINDEKHEINEISLDNEGNILTLIVNNINKETTRQFLTINGQSSSSKISLNSNYYLDKTNTFELDNKIYTTGYLFDKKKKLYVTPFAMKFDKTATSVDVPNLPLSEPIKKSLIDKYYYSEKKLLGEKINAVKLNHYLINQKGELIIVYEEQFNFMERINGLGYRYHYMNEVEILKFGKNDELLSWHVIPKETLSDADMFIYPTRTMIINEALYILYNEYERNINLKSFDQFKAKGDQLGIIRKYDLNSSEMKDVKITQPDSKSILIPSATGFSNGNFYYFLTNEMVLFKFKGTKIGRISIDNFK
jgi:hypothetical protein